MPAFVPLQDFTLPTVTFVMVLIFPQNGSLLCLLFTILARVIEHSIYKMQKLLSSHTHVIGNGWL